MIRKLVPYPLISLYRKLKRAQKRKENLGKSTEEIFSEIYRNNQWGGESGEFNSGVGSTNESISSAYLKCLNEQKDKLNFSELQAVDLGCGDMRIGSQIAGMFRSYTGVDIVKDLIEHHRVAFKEQAGAINFEHLNIVEEELPDGEVCFVRQVLQHLSNDQIGKVLIKLKKYRYVFITEHLPTPNADQKFNSDKPHGSDIRLYDNSGVFLSEPPFSVESSQLETVLEVDGCGYDNYEEPWIRGVIQTVLYTPNR